jgi:hypothetical protein
VAGHGLSRVDCGYSQAMMRSAHTVPSKWFVHGARFFVQGLRHADPPFRHHYFRGLAIEPRASGECRVPAFVEGHLGGKCDDSFVRMHSNLKAIQPLPQSVFCSVEMPKASSSAMHQQLTHVEVSALADTEKLMLPSG